jgi:hypothetical protein
MRENSGHQISPQFPGTEIKSLSINDLWIQMQTAPAIRNGFDGASRLDPKSGGSQEKP